MSLYNYFLTNPYGPGARTLEWIYLDRTGGGVTDLDSEPTYSADTTGQNCRLVVLSNTEAEVWQLIASNHVDDPLNGWVRPLDYGLAINEKVWKRVSCFTIGGGGGGTGLILNEVPTGIINGVNTTFTTANAFQGVSLDVYLNGLRQRYGVDYTILSSVSFNMTSAPIAGDTLIVDYIPL